MKEILTELGYNNYSTALKNEPHNIELAKEAIEYDSVYAGFMSDEMKDSRELVMEVIEALKDKTYVDSKAILAALSERLRDDEEIVRAFIKMRANAILAASERIKKNYDLVLECCFNYPAVLKKLGTEYRNNKKFMIDLFNRSYKTYRQNNIYIDCCDESIRDDIEVARVYCKAGIYYKFFSKRVRDEEEIVKLAFLSDSCALKYAPEKYKSDRDFVYAVCSNNAGNDFRYASEALKDDEELVLHICESDCIAFGHASDRIRKNRDNAVKFCKENPRLFGLISDIYSDDTEIAYIIAESKSPNYLLDKISENLRNDHDFMKKWCRNHEEGLFEASDEIKNDIEVCREAAKAGTSLFYMGEAAHDDFETVYYCVYHASDDLQYVSDRLKNDPLIVYAALDNYFPYVEYWQADDWDGQVFHDITCHIGKEIQEDESIARTVVKAFMETSFSKNYDADELMANPLNIYDIICHEGYEHGSDSGDCMHFTEEIKALIKERGLNYTVE